MLLFGIETSCDETATAIVDAATRTIVAQQVYSQVKEHAPYGGVIPELAARAHVERLLPLTQQTLTQAGLTWKDLHGLTATVAPGLTTALLMGRTFAQGLALATGLPFYPAHHLEGHALSPMLGSATLAPPYLLLLVSGGHTQLIHVPQVGTYHLLGTSVDDAAGECFDKVGKLLALPHPAGPALEALAATGNPTAIPFPVPRLQNPLNFSFSGLKTAVRDYLAKHPTAPRADVAASFQHTAAKILSETTARALKETALPTLVAGGGVAANSTIRAALEATAKAHGATFHAAPLPLCTDNAAMIAFATGQRLLHGLPPLPPDVRPRWPLSELTP